MELHGREEVIDGVDPSRTVGWFTALAPFLPVDAGPDADPLDVLDSARTARSRDGLEHGLLRFGTSDTTVRARLAGVDRPWLSVNYLGGLGSVFTGTAEPADEGLVEASLPDRGDRGPDNPRPFHWEFSAHMKGGELVLRLAHAEDGGRAEHLLDTACDYLRTLTTVLGTAERKESR